VVVQACALAVFSIFTTVEPLVEYQPAMRVPALQVGVALENVSFLILGKNETCAALSSTAIHFNLCLGSKMFCTENARMIRHKIFHQII